METLRSYLEGRWIDAHGTAETLVNPATEETLCEAPQEGLDLDRAAAHARAVGGARLRAMTFAERAAMLKALSQAIYARRDHLLDLAMLNGGNTRSDAKFDVDGASGTLMAYAELGASLGESRFLVDGDAVSLGRSSRVAGQHLLVPREGVAYHLNAFNFPAWGIAEKAAVALLAGVPVIARPNPVTALVTYEVMKAFVDSGALPEGALGLVTGHHGDLVDRLGPQDVLAFTGSSHTAALLRARPNLAAHAVHTNFEADSLNAAVLGADVERGSDLWQLFLSDVVRDMTQKTGQKCTAIRRVFVPETLVDAVEEDLIERLSTVKVGNPNADGVTMGPVATLAQLKSVRAGIDALVAAGARCALGGSAPVQGLGAPEGRGFFVAPTVLRVDDPGAVSLVHAREVFGPVATLIGYDGSAGAAAAAVRLGQGGLVTTLYSDDKRFLTEATLGVAAWHGRVCVASSKVVGAWMGPGVALPQLLHGGPGRAGGGEELGGLRGLGLYLQRVAVQGFGPWVEQLSAGGKRAG
ncbi:MAG: 3,4-dehydroadipyl-CoA semialdehyde dehydrogenase [Myxococcales bacterium]|nr:3,4-dehydroadipyl-CoA semialdehyde dehydrogenase [Myxococcales bacterium]